MASKILFSRVLYSFFTEKRYHMLSLITKTASHSFFAVVHLKVLRHMIWSEIRKYLTTGKHSSKPWHWDVGLTSQFLLFSTTKALSHQSSWSTHGLEKQHPSPSSRGVKSPSENYTSTKVSNPHSMIWWDKDLIVKIEKKKKQRNRVFLLVVVRHSGHAIVKGPFKNIETKVINIYSAG